jgi:hypothetical protein
MSGKPVGTIFAELDLDASRYTQGQQKLLKDATSTTLNIEQNFKNLGIKSAAEMDLMRAKIKNSFDMIANSSKAAGNDRVRAEEAMNAKLKALNDQQFGAQTSSIDKLKNNWIAAAAAVTAAIALIHKGMAYIEEGAKAMQVESSFKIMADSAGVNSEHLIESMKKATRETIDDSAMMQKAVKLMTLGYNPEQIERFSQVVITASQIAGTTAAEAYDELADAIANRMPKALVRMGAVTREQMKIVNAAIEAGADSIALYELAMANLELKQKMLQGTQNEAVIAMQRLKAQTEEMTEAIGKGLIWVLEKAYHSVEFYAAAIMGLISAYAQYRALVYSVMGDEKQAEDNRWTAARAMETRTELLKRWGDAVWGTAETEKIATKESIDESKAKINSQMEVLKAYADAAKVKAAADAEARKSEAVNKKFWEDYKKEVEGAFEFEKYKIQEQFKEFDKYVHDKLALQAWYRSEMRKIEIKEYSSGGIESEDKRGTFRSISELMSGSNDYGIESARSKAYSANTKANLEFNKSVEDQLAAMQKLDKELSEENWWKTYIEDIDDAIRANEIFKDSMNVMSQSTADALSKIALGTGSLKDNFNALVQSIVAGMIRMSTQQGSEALFGMLFKAGGSIASSYFGGSTPTGMGTNTDFGGGNTMGSFMAMVKHGGGTVDGGGPMRSIPASYFANAPRLHDGLAADEYPAILQRGEKVTKKGEAESKKEKQAITNNYTTINVAAPGGRMDRESIAQLQAGLYTTLQRAGQRNT